MDNDIEREAFELLRSLRGDYNCSCGHPKCSKAATQREIDEVLAAQPEQPSGWVVPDMTSAIVNDCCWTFVEAMPHNLPGPIFNDLKPALYEALKQYHGSMLTAAPAAPAVQGGGVPEPVCLVRQNEAGQIYMCKPDGSAFQLYNHVGQDFYTHPHNGEQGGEWVRCDERMPDNPCRKVIVEFNRWYGPNFLTLAKYSEPTGWICLEDCALFVNGDVVRWTEMPNPPTEREGE